MTARAAAALSTGGGLAEQVRARLAKVEVAHFDETALGGGLNFNAHSPKQMTSHPRCS